MQTEAVFEHIPARASLFNSCGLFGGVPPPIIPRKP